jgi:hypothetical protein
MMIHEGVGRTVNCDMSTTVQYYWARCFCYRILVGLPPRSSARNAYVNNSIRRGRHALQRRQHPMPFPNHSSASPCWCTGARPCASHSLTCHTEYWLPRSRLRGKMKGHDPALERLHRIISDASDLYRPCTFCGYGLFTYAHVEPLYSHCMCCREPSEFPHKC